MVAGILCGSLGGLLVANGIQSQVKSAEFLVIVGAVMVIVGAITGDVLTYLSYRNEVRGSDQAK